MSKDNDKEAGKTAPLPSLIENPAVACVDRGAIVKKLKNRDLVRAIFDSENPEAITRNLPAQSLYVAIRRAGLPSAIDLIELSTQKQIRLMLDFDLWSGDTFLEERFFEWLEVPDAAEADGNLAILSKIIACTDLKLLSLVMSRHIEVVVHDEPTDAPPGPDFYTPDRGHTWLKVEAQNERHVFVLNRALALLFETNTDIFYQLLGVPAAATETMLEEESFQDKQKRLWDEGIPDQDYAEEYLSPMSRRELDVILSAKAPERVANDTDVLPTFSFVDLNHIPKPLGDHITSKLELIEGGHFTYLCNNVAVKFKVDFAEPEKVDVLLSFVFGICNIGLEQASKVANKPAAEVFAFFDLKNLFRLGWATVLPVIKMAHGFRLEEQDSVTPVGPLIESLRMTPPLLPAFFEVVLEPGQSIPESLPAGFKPLEKLIEVSVTKRFLERSTEQGSERH